MIRPPLGLKVSGIIILKNLQQVMESGELAGMARERHLHCLGMCITAQ